MTAVLSLAWLVGAIGAPPSPPRPATSRYLVGAHYFPGWKEADGRSTPWAPVLPFPDRTPWFGYYDESNPAFTDWEIKWALEHGIQYFVYCWYRKTENVGRPVEPGAIFLEHAIREGLFRAHYSDRFKFAIMWENRQKGGVSSAEDLTENLLPFWVDNYFRHPSYLRVDGKPALFIYGPEKLVKDLGGLEQSRIALDRMRAAARKRGLPGVMVLCEYHGPDPATLARDLAAGCDAEFPYAIGPPWGGTPEQRKIGLRPSAPQVVAWQMSFLESWKRTGSIPFVPAASMGWDPLPWKKEGTGAPGYLRPETMTRWRLAPEQFEQLLQNVRTLMDGLPDGSPGRKMLLLDNWNEWGEGHFIAPHAGAGFGYLRAVRRVFTAQDNAPDYSGPDPADLESLRSR